MDLDRREVERLLKEVNTVGVADEADLPGIRRLVKGYLDQYRPGSVKIKPPKLLIERAKLYHRLVADLLLKQQGMNPMTLAAQQLVVALESSPAEFYWKDSAWAMSEVIAASLPHTLEIGMVDEDRWILFEQPHETPCGTVAALFVQYGTDMKTLAVAAKRCGMRDEQIAALRLVEPGIKGWRVYAVDDTGATIWSCILEYMPERNIQRWIYPPEACPDGACREYDEGIAKIFTLCPACKEKLTFWLSWLAAMTAMLRGDYRESAEPEEPQYITETEVRVERDAKQSWKRKEVKVPHRMRVVQFDAALAKSKSKQPRGSWTAGRDVGDASMIDMLDDNAVIYTSIEHGAHTRHFRHQRYKAARGTSRSFNATKAFTPVTVRYLKARRSQGEAKPLTVVSASRFETTESAENQ